MSSSAIGALLGPGGKRWVGRAAETVWSGGHSMMARLRPVSLAAPAAASRVLAIAPHPDDESIGCGGALIRHKQEGAEVVVACVTDGRTSRAFGLDANAMAVRRREEAEVCARILGIDRLEWMNLLAGEWDDRDLIGRLDALLRAYGPDLVYAPSLVDFHPEHRKVAAAIGRCWSAPSAAPCAVRIYPVQVPLTAALANVVVDVTRVMPQLCVAFDAYVTQAANMPRAVRQRRYAGRRYRAGAFAEEFWQLDSAAYARLHWDDVMREAAGFRGVREHAATDPLAYLAGWRSRRRLLDQP